MIKAHQVSPLGIPLKHLGVRKFTNKEWADLMNFYERNPKVNVRWQKIETKKRESGK